MSTFNTPETRPSLHEPGLSCRFEASFLGEDPPEVKDFHLRWTGLTYHWPQGNQPLY
jgi:hypothetical protein